jgi:hypothetical protein
MPAAANRAPCVCGRNIIRGRGGALHDQCSRCREGRDSAVRKARRGLRPKVVSSPRLSVSERAEGARLHLPVVDRPKTRGECGEERPCPFVSCKHHLFLDVTPGGSLRLNFPDLEPEQLIESCALDVADRGAATLEETGAIMNVTRERVRQIEEKALAGMAHDARSLVGKEG